MPVDQRFYTAHGPFSLNELIAGLSVEPPIKGLGDEIISGVSSLSEAAPGDMTFLTHKRHKDGLETCRATACFTPEDCAEFVSAAGIIPLISQHPKTHFARACARLFTVKDWRSEGETAVIADTARIHPSVVIGPGAVVSGHVVVGPYSVIGPGVRLGANTVIGSHVTVECADIGESCIIQSGARIGNSGFGIDGDEGGLLDLLHVGRVIIGNGVNIGNQSTVDRGYLGDTVLGDNVKLDNMVHIAHNVTVGEGTMMAGLVGIAGSSVIGKHVRLGGNVGIADHLTVGDGATLAARAGLMHNVPAGEHWSGMPAMPIRDHMRIVSATRKLIKKKTDRS